MLKEPEPSLSAEYFAGHLYAAQKQRNGSKMADPGFCRLLRVGNHL